MTEYDASDRAAAEEDALLDRIDPAACTHCYGEGEINERECEWCWGTGIACGHTEQHHRANVQFTYERGEIVEATCDACDVAVYEEPVGDYDYETGRYEGGTMWVTA